MKQSGLPVGKAPAALLAALLARAAPTTPDPSVLVGPATGEDAAVVRVGDRALVLARDPITFATADIGWYAVHVNANDVATRGAAPRWFLATILLPEGSPAELALGIVDQITAACADVGATLVGGHTEVTAGLPRPIVAGTMAGEVALANLLTTGAAQPGDTLLLTQAIAIEGTALLATELAADVDAALGGAFGQRCRDLLRAPGLSVVLAAQVAAAAGARALHDPTEGGLATALHELADAAGCGLLIDADAVPVLPETRRLCDHFGLDPLGLLASGSLLIAAAPERATAVTVALAGQAIPVAAVGQLEPAAADRCLRRAGHNSPLPHFDRDEVARLLNG
ncbi:MAG: hydrogenase expression protein [Chloroflexi bacterium]|nr:hydrogenase expression protein [Chloroflexota bacterium]